MLIRRGLHLRVESGLLSGIDLASDDPGTKMMVSVLAAVLEFQRDMISENIREGVAAAAASGKTLGRPTAVSTDTAEEIVAAYHNGTAVKALARQHEVAPRTIRRILDTVGAWALEETTDGPEEDIQDASAAMVPNPAVALDVPGLIADHLCTAGDGAVQAALREGQTVRRGQGHTVRLTATLDLHRAALELSAALAAGPAGRKACRVYAARIAAVDTTSARSTS